MLSGVLCGVCTRTLMPWSRVSGMPVGEAMVAVRRPVEPRGCPGTQFWPQPVGRSSKAKPGGAMMRSSRTTAVPCCTLSVTSMIAPGGLRSFVTSSCIFSTGVKPGVSPSLVFVGYVRPSTVSKRHVFMPGLGLTTRITV